MRHAKSLDIQDISVVVKTELTIASSNQVLVFLYEHHAMMDIAVFDWSHAHCVLPAEIAGFRM